MTSDDNRQDTGQSRREFLTNAATVGAGLSILGTLPEHANAAGEAGQSAAPGITVHTPVATSKVSVTLKVNGQPSSLSVDPRTSLLDAVREHLGLTGAKKGCDHGQCGACTMIIDGRRINSCLTFAWMYQGKEITTIEGIGEDDRLHDLQAAFIKNDGFQCGFCTPGQICSAIAMLEEHKAGQISCVTEDVADTGAKVELSEAEIKERMSGNICRCGAYPGIVASIKEAAGVQS